MERESERIGKHLMHNYDFMRSEINEWKDDMIEKGFMVTMPDGTSMLTEAWHIHNKKLDKEEEAKRKGVKDMTYHGWTFFTLSPDKNLNKSKDQIDLNELNKWCERWFAPYNYTQWHWAIEHGSNEEAHYHVHALVHGLKKRLKREGHYKELKDQWNKSLSKQLVTVGSWAQKQVTKKSYDILWQPINSKELWEMKYNYLTDELKGSHQNFIDLKLGGDPG